MKLLLKNIDGIRIPERAHDDDAGYDIFTVLDPLVTGVNEEGKLIKNGEAKGLWRRVDFIEYRTNLFWTPEAEKHIEIFPRSSLSKYNLLLCNSVGTIDTGYTGEILCRFRYIWQPEDLRVVPFQGIMGWINIEKIYKNGDAIAQMKGRDNVSLEFEFVNELGETKRADGGFGSSKK